MLGFIVRPLGSILYARDFGFFTLVLSATGVIALAAVHRNSTAAMLRAAVTAVAIALVLTWLGEWKWWSSVFHEHPGFTSDASLSVDERMAKVGAWFLVIFLVFAAAPYFCDDRK